MKLGIVLTNDWELFGDGSGDFYQIQYNPSLDLLQLLNDFDAKITLFAEVMQQITFKNSKIEKFTKISEDWEKLIQKFYQSGHSIQLHIHPQWHNSKFENEKWILDENNWSIGKLDKTLSKKLILDGKNYLESIIKEINKIYKVKSFRAGAFYIEPSKNIIEILNEIDILSDTSVTKGFYNKNYYDFRNSFSNLLPYNVSNKEVKHQGNNKLIEFPIYSKKFIFSEALNKFFPKISNKVFLGNQIKDEEIQWFTERNNFKNRVYPIENRVYKKNEKKNISWYLNKVISKKWIQLDYDYLPASLFSKIIYDLLDDKSLNDKFNGKTVPVIAIGHIKDAFDNKNLKNILEYLTKNERIKFINFDEAIQLSNEILKKNPD